MRTYDRSFYQSVLVFAPVALVPFHSCEIFSALDLAAALNPLSAGRDPAVVAIERTPRSWTGRGSLAGGMLR